MQRLRKETKTKIQVNKRILLTRRNVQIITRLLIKGGLFVLAIIVAGTAAFAPNSEFTEIKQAKAAPKTIVLNTTQTILTEGTSWTVPDDWTDGNNTIEVIGGGGVGFSDTTLLAGAGGGGGGAYSKVTNLDLTPGATVTYQIGQGGLNGNVPNGTDTFFNRTSGSAGTCADTTSVCAKGGNGATSVTGATGGLASGGTGSTKYDGGNGGTGHTNSDSGGGGGGAAGPLGDGGNGGAASTSATNGSQSGGGGGGNGDNTTTGGATGGTGGATGGAGGNGEGGTGGGTGGNAADGGSGTAGTGGGGGGGDDAMDGGHGATGSEFAGGTVGSGGGGGGAGDMTASLAGGDGGLYGAGGGGGAPGGRGAPGIIVITYNGNTPSNGTWTVPLDWNSANNSIEVIGAGGAGYSGANGTGARGGGGGAYSKITNLNLTGGSSVNYQIGQGGRKTGVGTNQAGLNGGDTWFNGSGSTCSAQSVCAKGGGGGTSGTTGGGAGGAAGSGIGTEKSSGGTGGSGNGTGDSGGGGGGAAGRGNNLTARNGGNGSGTADQGGGGGGGASGGSSSAGGTGGATGGTGGNGEGGTGGGAGGSPGSNGTADSGGGGGGGNDGQGGGHGATGSNFSTGIGSGGGGGGMGDNTSGYRGGGMGGWAGGGGGGGKLGGFGGNGLIVITYEPLVAIDISGTCDAYDQTTDCGDTGTIRVAVNGVLAAQTQSNVSGVWTVSSVIVPSGAVVTVFIDGVGSNSDKAVAYLEYNGTGNITGVKLFKEHITIGSAENSTTLSAADINLYDASNDSDILIEGSASSVTCNGVASFSGVCTDANGQSSQERIYIDSGDTFVPGDSTSLAITKMDIRGTFTGGASGVMHVTGAGTNTTCGHSAQMSICNNGGTFSPPGTVNFVGSAADVVIAASYTNLNVSPSANSTTFTLGSGTFTVSGNIIFGNGTNTGVVINGATNDPNVTTTGSSSMMTISANTELQAGDGIWTLSGGGAGAAVAFDAQSAGTWQDVTTLNQTFNHTVSGSDRILLVAVGIRGNDNNATVSGITYNGDALTKITDVPFNTYTLRSELWYLIAPDTGTNVVDVTISNYAGSSWNSVAVSYTGVDQNSPIGATNTNAQETGAGTSISTNITTNTNDSWIFDAVFHRNDVVLTEGASQNVRANTNNGASILETSDKLASTSGGYTMSWTDGADHSWRHILAELKDSSSSFAPLVVSGTLTANSSTFRYTSTASAVMTPATYYNLEVKPGANSITHMFSSGTYTVNGNLVIGNGTNTGVIVDAETNDPTITVAGSATISASTTFSASSTNALTIGDDFIVSGTFTANSGTVVFNSSGNVATVSGSNTFNNVTVTTAGKNIDFTAGTTTTINGLLTVTGTNGNNVVFDSTAASVWTINHQGTESITYLTVNWGACHGSSTTITMGTGSTKDGNTGACWDPPASAITVSGTVYLSDGTTADTTGHTLNLSLGGGVAVSTTSNGSGVFSFTNFGPPAAGDILTIWIGGGTYFGTLVFKYGTSCTGNPDCTGLSLIRDTVSIDSKNGTAIANSDLSSCDINDGGFGCNSSDLGFDSDGTDLTVSDGMRLRVNAGATFTPGGTITTSVSSNAASADGDIQIISSGTLSMGTNALSVGGDFSSLGVMSKSTGQTTTFTATATGHTIHNNYSNWENVVLNGAGGGWSFGSSHADLTIDGDLTVTTGTLSGTLPVNVNGGDVTGNGTINLTGGTFTVSGTGSFGGNTGWNFSSLTFSGNAQTTTSTFGFAVGPTISTVLTIGSGHTLIANSYSYWVLTGTGTPFVASGILSAHNNSVFRYSGNGATNIASSSNGGTSITYGGLEIEPGGTSTHTLGTASGHTINVYQIRFGNDSTAGNILANTHNPTLNVTQEFTIRSMATYVTGNGTITYAGCSTNQFGRSGTFTASSGNTVVFSCTNPNASPNLLNNTMTGSNAFYNLTIDGDGGGDTFTLGFDFNVTNDLTVSSGDILASANNVTVNGVVGGTGTITHTANTFTHNTTTSKNFGDSGSWTFNNLTLSGASGTTLANGSGSITVTGVLTNSANHTLNAGSKTWIITGTSSPFVQSGSFTPSTSTFSFRSLGGVATGANSFYNLDFSPASGTYTYTGGGAGTMSIANDLTLGGAGNVELDFSIASDAFDVGGNVVIGTGDSIISDSTTNYVGGSWTNSGTFTHNSSTVVFDATSTGKTITTNTTNGKFYNITFNGTGGGWTLQDNPSIVNTLTIANGNLDASSRSIYLEASGTPFVKSGGTFTQGTSTVIYNGTSATNILALNGASTTDAYYNLYVGENVDSNSVTYTLAGDTTVNNVITVSHASSTGTDTLLANVTLTLKGSGTPLNIISGKGAFSSSYGSGGKTIYSSASGTTALSTIDMTSTNGFGWLEINGTGTFNIGSNIDLDVTRFSVTSGTLTGSSNNLSVTTYVEGGGDVNLTGGTFTYTGGSYFGTGNTTDWDFYNLVFGDGVSSVSPYTQGTADIDVANQMVITANTNFSPQAGYNKVFNLNSAGTPLVVNGSLTPADTTFNYNGGGATTVVATTYFNLGIKPGANSATHTIGTSGAQTLTVGGTLTIGNGTNTGVIVNASTYNPNIDLNGTGTSIDIKANTTFQAPVGSNFTVAGSWANAGTFTHNGATVTFDATGTGKTIQSNGSSFNNIIFNGSGGGWSPSDAMVLAGDLTMTAGTLIGTQNVTVNGGDVTGNGDIDMTAGNFTLTGTGSFGGNTAWDFTDLTFSGTTTSTGSGSVVIDNVLTLGVSGTLNAGSRVWRLAGSSTPFSFSVGSVFNSDTSTFDYISATGVSNAMSSDAMTGANAFYILRLFSSVAGQTFNAGVSLEAKNRVFLANTGTLAMGDNNLTIGNTGIANSGNLAVQTSTGGYLTQSASATTTLLSSAGGSNCIGNGTIGTSCSIFDGIAASFTFGNLVIGDGVNAQTTSINGGATTSIPHSISGTLTVTANSTLDLGTAGGITTVNLTGNGTPLVVNGSLLAATSNINFNSAATTGTTIPALAYYNLGMNKASNTFTAAGAITVNNDFTITAGTFVAPAGNLTIVDDFTNNGTFTHNSGTVVMTPAASDTVVIGGSSNTTFNNLTNTTGGTRIQFANGRTYAIDGTMTMTGTSGRPIWLQSNSDGVQWLIDVNGSTSLSYVNVKDSGCSNSADINPGTKVYNQGNNGTCWKFKIRGAGIVFDGPGSGSAGQGGGGASGGSGGSSGGGAGSGGSGAGAGATSVTRTLGSVSEDTSFGQWSWSSLTVGNLNSDDNGYASSAYSPAGTIATYYIKATNFGFSLPTDSTVNGVVVEILRCRQQGTTTDNQIRLVIAGSVSGTNNAVGGNWSFCSNETYTSYGASNSLWGNALTPAVVNSSNFGVAVSVNLTSDGEYSLGDASVDHIRMTVHYTTSVSSGGGGGGDGGASP